MHLLPLDRALSLAPSTAGSVTGRSVSWWPWISRSSSCQAEEYGTADGEGEEAGHAVIEELDAALQVAGLLRDDFGVIVRLVGQEVNDVVGQECLHGILEVFDGHAGDGVEEER